MNEKINNLAVFSVLLTHGEVRDILDFYIPLKNYCSKNPNEKITEDFNDVIKIRTGLTLVYLRIKINLLNEKYEKWGTESYLKEIKELEEEYQEFYAPYINQIEKGHHM